MLGLDAQDSEVTITLDCRSRSGRVYVHGMHAFGTRWDIEAIGTDKSRPLPLRATPDDIA
jgi:hypothetical protein